MHRHLRTGLSALVIALCAGLFLTGCGKKRIYSDTPPGASVRTQTAAKASVPAGATPATAREEAAQPAAQVQNTESQNTQAQQAEALGSELASEPDLLSGTAGMLDDELIGFPMADGSSYDPEALVAGHRTLPLGSTVEVTSVATGKSVTVTIADRGPFEKSRVTDLSRAAMQGLGLSGEGEVRMKVVGASLSSAALSSASSASAVPPAPTTLPAQQSAMQMKTAPVSEPILHTKTAPLPEPFYVQVGAFADAANGQSVLTRLVEKGYAGSRLTGGEDGTMVRVQAGPLPDRAAAQQAVDQLRAEYPASFIVTPD